MCEGWTVSGAGVVMSYKEDDEDAPWHSIGIKINGQEYQIEKDATSWVMVYEFLKMRGQKSPKPDKWKAFLVIQDSLVQIPVDDTPLALNEGEQYAIISEGTDPVDFLRTGGLTALRRKL